MKALMKLFTNNKEVRLYRPTLKKIAGSTNGSIFLNQAIYWSTKRNNDWFYKFNGPCSHKLYKEGDSWEEELYFSAKEFKTVKKRLVFTIGAREEKKFQKEYKEGWEKEYQKAIDNAYIISYQTPNRLTFYKVNTMKIDKEVSALYVEHDETAKSTFDSKNQLKTDWDFSFSNSFTYECKENQVEKEASTFTGSEKKLKTGWDSSKRTNDILDITKNTSKNNKYPGNLASLSEEDKSSIKAVMKKAMNLIPVSKAMSSTSEKKSDIFITEYLFPLAEQKGVSSVIGSLKSIYTEAKNEPINDLKRLIISKM